MSHLHLADLRAGQRAVVRAVRGDRAYRRRLMELGFLPGTRVRLIRRLDVGDVLEVELRESRVSLRISEARVLEVEPAEAVADPPCCGSGAGEDDACAEACPGDPRAPSAASGVDGPPAPTAPSATPGAAP